MRKALSALLLVSLIVAATTSQDRPDFSGTWDLISPILRPENAPQTLVVNATFKRQSVNGIPINPPLVTLAVESRFGNAIRSDTYNVGMIGGFVGGLPRQVPQTSSRFSTRWGGAKLIVALGNYADGKLMSEHGEVWSLDRQGLLSVAITDHMAGDAPTTTNLIYRHLN